tara:strand:+ start:2786 stop:3226 length:441 start_codon:yes stop_codon:yes gene_type:complete
LLNQNSINQRFFFEEESTMRRYEFECIVLQNEGNARIRRYIESEWNQAVERVENWIRNVSITLTDVNGPRGGISKRCRIILQTQLGAPIIVQETQDRISSAISLAIKRAAHTLKRKIAKKHDQKHRPPQLNLEPDRELEEAQHEED